MRIRWTPAAAVDLQRISDYLRDHHPHYREATIRKLYGAIQSRQNGRIAVVRVARKERGSYCSRLYLTSQSIA